ncbi:hypothetical protein M8C21_029068 [Ambrosia artemisiifolia]|uniref:Uncharacterized protein n=1 Tax=Ambrosia artemisiifolia TaxID=4212 RepID=A0AAD5CY79_AMBAR|nr:hypothetical protein M8C21_029068 [Ambrosia artemisiifolia]
MPTAFFFELKTVHIGQASIQVGNACWELYYLEHGIQTCVERGCHFTKFIDATDAEVAYGLNFLEAFNIDALKRVGSAGMYWKIRHSEHQKPSSNSSI